MNNKIWLLGFALVCAETVNAQAVAFIRQFGTPQYDSIRALAVGKYGKIYVGGETEGALGGPLVCAVSTEGFVRQYNSQGTALWTRHFAVNDGWCDPAREFLFNDLAAGAGAVWVVSSGPYGEPSVKSKFDAALGTIIESGPAPGIRTNGIESEGNHVYYAGSSCPSGSCSAFEVPYVAKYTAAGEEVWTREFETEGWAISLDAYSGSVYVAGVLEEDGTSDWDGFLRKYNAQGNVVWTRQIGTPNTYLATEVAADAGGVYVAGYTDGTLPGQTSAGGADVFVRKYSHLGNLIWTRQFGTSSHEFMRGIAVDTSGIYLVGLTGGVFPGQSSAGGFEDIFVRKYNSQGNVLWTRQIGTSDGESAESVGVDATGVYVAGYTWGAFPGQINKGDRDAFIMKLLHNSPTGAPDFFSPGDEN